VNLPVTYFANFSPYHDPDPISDFYDDFAQRITSIIATVLGIHLAIFFMMSPRFVMPDLKVDPPEAISVELVQLEEQEFEPDPIVTKTVIKAPSVKPKPKPAPELEPTPVPDPIVEPTPDPAINDAPPPPPAPPPAAEPVPEPIPEPVPQTVQEQVASQPEPYESMTLVRKPKLNQNRPFQHLLRQSQSLLSKFLNPHRRH